jgi:hypothetical protein
VLLGAEPVCPYRVYSGPREDATRIGSAGVIRRQAVDISPLRRVNQVRCDRFEGIRTLAGIRSKHGPYRPTHFSSSVEGHYFCLRGDQRLSVRQSK